MPHDFLIWKELKMVLHVLNVAGVVLSKSSVAAEEWEAAKLPGWHWLHLPSIKLVG